MDDSLSSTSLRGIPKSYSVPLQVASEEKGKSNKDLGGMELSQFGMLSGLQTNGGCRLPGDRQHRARTTPDADICSYLSRCADGETMSPDLMGS